MVGLIVKPELPAKDVDLSDDADVNRYYYYICNGVDTINAAGIDEKAVRKILVLVPKILRKRYPDFSNNLMAEIKEGFTMNMKRAIIEFALTDYLEEHAKVVPSKGDELNVGQNMKLNRVNLANLTNLTYVVLREGDEC